MKILRFIEKICRSQRLILIKNYGIILKFIGINIR